MFAVFHDFAEAGLDPGMKTLQSFLSVCGKSNHSIFSAVRVDKSGVRSMLRSRREKLRGAASSVHALFFCQLGKLREINAKQAEVDHRIASCQDQQPVKIVSE